MAPSAGGNPERDGRGETDYSPVVEETGAAEKRRERRKWGAFLPGAHLFWLYALLLAAVVLILYFVLR